MKLLLIEDNPQLQTSLGRSLERRGMRVAICADGLQALSAWRVEAPDLVLLDLSLPGLDGLEVLGQARAAGLRTPVIILTARGTVGDKILGLNQGADDYLPKPFDLDELEARIRALVRRLQPADLKVPALVRQARPAFCGLSLDSDSGSVEFRGQPLELPPRELALLRALLSKPGHAIAKERLFEQVFPGESEVQYDAIEVVVYRLRRKLAGVPVQIMTLRGLGYLLKAQT
jgi:two-component system response regulator TctD